MELGSWYQLKYSKLISEVNGAIVAGSGNGPKGCSAPIDFLKDRCIPTAIGTGPESRSLDSRHAWMKLWPSDVTTKEQCSYRIGALAYRPYRIEGKTIGIACRVRQRPEDGEGGGGRHFVVAHYLVQVAEGLANLPLIPLPTYLCTEPPLREENWKPLSVPEANEQLPPNWLTLVEPMLSSVLAGRLYHTSDGDPEDFYHRTMWCLACLPGSLRWRVAFGCGMYRIDRSIIFGHGMPGTGLEGLPGGTSDNSPDDPAVQSYLTWLAFHVGSLAPEQRTLRTISRRIDEELSDFAAWDALDAEYDGELIVPWQGIQLVVDFVHRNVRQLAILGWLRGNLSEPAPLPIDCTSATTETLLAAVATCCLRPLSVDQWQALQPVLDWATSPTFADRWAALSQHRDFGDPIYAFASVHSFIPPDVRILPMAAFWQLSANRTRRYVEYLETAVLHFLKEHEDDSLNILRALLDLQRGQWLRGVRLLEEAAQSLVMAVCLRPPLSQAIDANCLELDQLSRHALSDVARLKSSGEWPHVTELVSLWRYLYNAAKQCYQSEHADYPLIDDAWSAVTVRHQHVATLLPLPGAFSRSHEDREGESIAPYPPYARRVFGPATSVAYLATWAVENEDVNTPILDSVLSHWTCLDADIQQAFLAAVARSTAEPYSSMLCSSSTPIDAGADIELGRRAFGALVAENDTSVIEAAIKYCRRCHISTLTTGVVKSHDRVEEQHIAGTLHRLAWTTSASTLTPSLQALSWRSRPNSGSPPEISLEDAMALAFLWDNRVDEAASPLLRPSTMDGGAIDFDAKTVPAKCTLPQLRTLIATLAYTQAEHVSSDVAASCVKESLRLDPKWQRLSELFYSDRVKRMAVSSLSWIRLLLLAPQPAQRVELHPSYEALSLLRYRDVLELQSRRQIPEWLMQERMTGDVEECKPAPRSTKYLDAVVTATTEQVSQIEKRSAASSTRIRALLWILSVLIALLSGAAIGLVSR